MTSLVFPDVTALALQTLGESLNVPTGTIVPNPRPPRFVLARRSGGSRVTPVSEAVMIAFEAWGQTPADADDLAQEAIEALYAWSPPGAMAGRVINGVTIYRVSEVGGPADVPDELSDQPRSTFTLEIQVRGQTLETGSS